MTPTPHALALLAELAGFANESAPPTNARRVFPTIDEPDRKTPWTVTLDVPAALVAVGNMPVAETKELGAIKRVKFAPTPPVPSYLVAFGVGPFEIIDAGATKQSKTPMRVIVPKGQTPRGAFAKRIVPLATDALESYL